MRRRYTMEYWIGFADPPFRSFRNQKGDLFRDFEQDRCSVNFISRRYRRQAFRVAQGLADQHGSRMEIHVHYLGMYRGQRGRWEKMRWTILPDAGRYVGAQR